MAKTQSGRRKKGFYLLLAVGAVLVVAIATMLILKSYPISCSESVDVSQARQAWSEGQDARAEVSNLEGQGRFAEIRLDESKCPGKAFLNIRYDTQDTRNRINDAIDGSSLESLPIEWQNV